MSDSSFDYSVHYRAWHSEDEEHVERVISGYRTMLEPLLLPAPPGAALDIGCGMGFGVLALNRLGYAAEGIESDNEQVEACRRLGVKVTHTGDIEGYLAERRRKYTLVTLFDLLEHLPKSVHIPVMRSVREALKPGGRAILTVPNASSVLAARHFYIDWTHEWCFTEYSLRFVLINAGFPRVKVLPTEFRKRPPVRLWRKTARAGLRKWLVRWVWRQVLLAEYDHDPRLGEIPIDLNLVGVGEA